MNKQPIDEIVNIKEEPEFICYFYEDGDYIIHGYGTAFYSDGFNLAQLKIRKYTHFCILTKEEYRSICLKESIENLAKASENHINTMEYSMWRIMEIANVKESENIRFNYLQARNLSIRRLHKEFPNYNFNFTFYIN